MSRDNLGTVLLIASPQMKDPFFERAVVLVWHHDADGALGVIINRPVDHSLEDVLATSKQLPSMDEGRSEVVWGGPVETHAGTVVTLGSIQQDEGWQLPCGVAVTRSQDALERLMHENERLILALGYAGWGPGQLDDELQQGGWLWTDVDTELMFDVPMRSRWESALATLGLTPHNVWMRPIDE